MRLKNRREPAKLREMIWNVSACAGEVVGVHVGAEQANVYIARVAYPGNFLSPGAQYVAIGRSPAPWAIQPEDWGVRSEDAGPGRGRTSVHRARRLAAGGRRATSLDVDDPPGMEGYDSMMSSPDFRPDAAPSDRTSIGLLMGGLVLPFAAAGIGPGTASRALCIVALLCWLLLPVWYPFFAIRTGVIGGGHRVFKRQEPFRFWLGLATYEALLLTVSFCIASVLYSDLE